MMSTERARQIRVFVYVCLVGLTAPILFFTLVRAQPSVVLPTDRDNIPAFLLFSLLLFLGETQPRLSMRFGDNGEVTPGWAFAYALVLIGSPAGAVIVMVLANLYCDTKTHKGVLRTVFNTAQVTIALSLGGLVLYAFGVDQGITGADHLPLRTGVGFLIAGAATFLCNAVLTTIVLCLHQGISPTSMMRSSFGLSLAVDGALLALAPLFVIAIEFSILMLPLLGITAFLVYQSARTALSREHEANHDSLTGLLNRRAFDERLEEAIDDDRDGRHPVVLIMDLDRFKDINDRLGHPIGDKLLVSFAERLERLLPSTAHAARLGGDEFAVILVGVRSLDEAKGAVTRLHAQLSERHQLSGFPLSAAVSIGAAMAPRNGTSGTALVAAADLAMYRAKQFRSGIEFAAGSDNHLDVGRVGLLGDLAKAIGTDQIVVHYQPMIRLSDGDPEGVEALVRWHHPLYGAIPPVDFIAMTEQTDLIGPLTESMFRIAVRELLTLGPDVPRLSLNIAARNLLDRQFPSMILSVMNEMRFPPHLLELELTERDIVTNSERSALTLARLRDAGVRIAIDDFGTGYSSLLTLRDLHADRIKIDQSFTTNMVESPTDALIVAKVIEIAHELNLDVVAEGVESDAVWTRLRQLGCDVAQGYAIAKAMPASELGEWFRVVRLHTRRLAEQRAQAAEDAARGELRPGRVMAL